MFKKLLVPLDRSALAEQALGQAAALARAADGAVDLVLVHEPLPFDGFGDAPWNAELRKQEERYVQSTANELAIGTGVPVTGGVLTGARVEVICKRAWDVGADCVVMTSHGRTGLSRAWLGSVADGVIRHSVIPVLLLRSEETKAADRAARYLFKHVLVPLDGSALSADALKSAAAIAQTTGASISLLRVVTAVPMVTVDAGLPFVYPYPIAVPDDRATRDVVDLAKQEMADLAQQLVDAGAAKVTTAVVVDARVAPAIIDYANSHGVDLIAMSTHGRGASRLFLGSVTDKIIRGSATPILVHKPLGVLAPVETRDATEAAPVPALAAN